MALEVYVGLFWWFASSDAARVGAVAVFALLVGFVRLGWLARALDPGASIRRVEFGQPAYVLCVRAERARFDVRAAPFLSSVAIVGLTLTALFGAPALLRLINGHGLPPTVLLGLFGGVVALLTAPLATTRMTIDVSPGRLEFELARLLRPTTRWAIRPESVGFTCHGRCLAMEMTYVPGHGVPGFQLFDCGLADPSAELLKDLVAVGATLTAVGATARGPV